MQNVFKVDFFLFTKFETYFNKENNNENKNL